MKMTLAHYAALKTKVLPLVPKIAPLQAALQSDQKAKISISVYCGMCSMRLAS